jgi:1-aminocyclopropane-1-carboxylate deaminase/D-cysteine desulfhydrase-like pyridoxal-dependent ACC family enzyme
MSQPMLSLFESYPLLPGRLPHTPLGSLPTPVQRLDGLCKRLGVDNLCIKRDDLSAGLYGGNKVRKLEFLLADARRAGARTVITTGGAGSNHALATSLYARQVGLKSVILLSDQPNSRAVRANLLMDLHVQAEVHVFRTFAEQRGAFDGIVSEIRRRDGCDPYVIAAGGSSPVGALGFVNAGLELRGQIDRGELPMPDVVYLAFGTMGTAAGLLLGLRAAGLNARVVGVRVVPTVVGNEEKFWVLFQQTNSLLHDADPSFPLIDAGAADITVTHDFFGQEYGLFTKEAVEAIRTVNDTDAVQLDGVYTGKAFAAFTQHARVKPAGEAALFWLTRNSRPFPPEAMSADYHLLPPAAHHYFEEDVQPLDRM